MICIKKKDVRVVLSSEPNALPGAWSLEMANKENTATSHEMI